MTLEREEMKCIGTGLFALESINTTIGAIEGWSGRVVDRIA